LSILITYLFIYLFIYLFTSLATYPFYRCTMKFSLSRKVKATERKGFAGTDYDMNVQARHRHYSDGITLPFRAKTRTKK